MAFSPTVAGAPKSEINITPLVDVVLVLLIIFMVAMPILQMGLDVEVPPKMEMVAPPPVTEQNQLVITIKSDGVYLNSQLMGSITALRDAIAGQMKDRPLAERVVFINSEDDLSFDRAVQAMDAAHEAGAAKVGFLTDPPRKQ